MMRAWRFLGLPIVAALFLAGCGVSTMTMHTPSWVYDNIEDIFRSNLPVGDTSSSSSSSGWGGTGGRAEQRFTLHPVADERVDLPATIEGVIGQIEGRGYTVEHDQKRNADDGRDLAGTLHYRGGDHEGDIRYELKTAGDCEPIEVSIIIEERTAPTP